MIIKKTLFTVFVLLSATLFGQDNTNAKKFGSWSIRTYTFANEEIYDNHEIYSEMRVIAGNDNFEEKLYYSIGVWSASSNEDVELYVRLEGLGYTYDESPEDKNYLSLKVIFSNDESKQYSVTGRIRQSGNIYLSYEDEVKPGQLMRDSNAMWIKNGGVVTKINLDGIDEALNEFLTRWEASEVKEENPFEKTTDQVKNPFGNDSK